MNTAKKNVVSTETLGTFLRELESSMRQLNHSLRSPLSVMLGIIEDLETGVTLSSEDIADGKQALTRATSLLKSLALPTPTSDLKELSAKTLVQALESILPAIPVEIALTAKTTAKLPMNYLFPLLSIVSEINSCPKKLFCYESQDGSSVTLLFSQSPTDCNDVPSIALNPLAVAKLDSLSATSVAALHLYLTICGATLVESSEGELGIHFSFEEIS